jgi:hypothetical protein
MLSGKTTIGRFTLVCAAGLILAASGLVWSKSRSGGGDEMRSEIATASAISPLELLLKRSEPLLAERWDAF